MKVNKFLGVIFMAASILTSCSSVPEEKKLSENEVQSGQRFLIINADDLCYDQATNDAIIKCYKEGIVTSTTAYVNFPDSIKLLKEVHQQYPDFPIGIHLNITFGKPVLPPEEIPTLVNKKTGEFWNEDQILTHIADMSYDEVQKEIHAQIELFRSSGVPLDHIDYHNHLLALYTPYHQIVREEAARLNIPVRNPVPISSYKIIKVSGGGGDSAAISKLIIYGMLHPFKSIPMMKKVGVSAFIEQEKITKEMGIKTPDWFVDVFYENSTNETFLSIINQLPVGVSEIMCHPGSSQKELEILTDTKVKSEVLEKGIVLTNFHRN